MIQYRVLFSNECHWTKTKEINLASNHRRRKLDSETIRIRSNRVTPEPSAGKSGRAGDDWFWICLSLVEKVALVLLGYHRVKWTWTGTNTNDFRHSSKKCSNLPNKWQGYTLQSFQTSKPGPQSWKLEMSARCMKERFHFFRPLYLRRFCWKSPLSLFPARLDWKSSSRCRAKLLPLLWKYLSIQWSGINNAYT